MAHERVGEHRDILVHIFEYAGEWFALAMYLSTSRGWLQRQPALLHEVRGDALTWRGHVLELDRECLDPEFEDDMEYGWWTRQRIDCDMHLDDLQRAYESSSPSDSSSSWSDL